ncbi:hypothetical protein [Mumia quercus]|uniref:hypothetical protein n=1 Tax=Mumia quercus TaxID=2976125 RepID=UPI0021CE454C|nr:hypothetical protein [Mumia quercus]
MRELLTRAALLVAVVGLSAACGSSDSDSAEALASDFTRAAVDSGVAPEMTTELAKSLYGDDGGSVCAALDEQPDDVALPWAWTRVTAMPDEHVQDLVDYDRVVVDVYCPDEKETLDALLDDLNFDPA